MVNDDLADLHSLIDSMTSTTTARDNDLASQLNELKDQLNKIRFQDANQPTLAQGDVNYADSQQPQLIPLSSGDSESLDRIRRRVDKHGKNIAFCQSFFPDRPRTAGGE